MTIRSTVLRGLVACLAVASMASAAVIYTDDFSGSSPTLLNGTAPDVRPGGQTWTARTDASLWYADGSKTTNGSSHAWLPFVPYAGNRYTLSLDVNPNYVVNNSDWFALGFSASNVVNNAFHDGANQAVAWILNRSDDLSSSAFQTFLGPSTTIPGVSHDPSPDLVGWLNMKIILDTQGANWTAQWYANNVPLRATPATFTSTPTINYVGFGSYNNTQGMVDNFSLTSDFPVFVLRRHYPMDDNAANTTVANTSGVGANATYEVKAGRLTLKATSGDATLLSYILPFEVGKYNHRLQPVPDPDPNEFPFSAKFNPVRGLLQISGDSYFLPDPDAAKGLHYEVKHRDTGKIVASGDITEAHVWRYEDVLTLADVAPGAYEATARLVLKDGKTFGPRTGSFEKKDEAKTFAHWWGKDPGNSERVLPPFTPIARRGGALRCWGREYALSALGLPTAITSQDGAVLAAPARIVVSVGGKETAIRMGRPKVTDAKDWRVRFEGKAEGAGLAFAAKGWMEQDGLVCVELTYGPSGKPVKVDALRIEYPVANGVAECLASVGPGANFAAMTATVLPADKQGRLWTTFDTGRPGAQMTAGSFYPHVWLGSEQRGFQWWADSDKGWFPDDDVPAHEVAREGGAVVLKNHIIGKPVELSAPRTLTFTWNASPFKPLPKGWRMIAATDDGTFSVPHRGTRINPTTGKKYLEGGIANWINPESYDPADWGKLWAEQKEKADAIVRARRPFDLYGSRTGVSWQHMSFQLIGWGRKSMEDAVHDYFGSEWAGETWNKTYVDYAMYLFDRAFGEGGVVSTYWDLSFPILWGDPLTGLAYQLPDGRWQPGYNTLNCRRFFQRLWAVQDKHGLNPGSVGCHSTQAYIFPALPWIDAVLDGERDWNIDVSDMDWVDYYPKERMRAMSVPHTWGVGICWMSNFASADVKKKFAAKTRHAEYVWLHDSWINPYLDYGFLTRMPQGILDWGLNGENVAFVPYWRNPYAKADDPDLLVALWRIPDEAAGRILVGVFNYNRKSVKDAEVKLDLAQLGLAGKPLDMRDLSRDYFLGVKEIEAIQGELGETAAFDAAGGVLRIKGLGAHRGRFVGIGATAPAAVETLAKQLPAWAAREALPAISDQGFVRKETRRFAPGRVPGVACEDAAIQVGMWQLPDRVLLLVHSADEKVAKDAVLKLDLEALHLTPKLPWQEFLGVRDLQKDEKAPGAMLDYYAGKLTLKAIPPKGGRIVAIRRY